MLNKVILIGRVVAKPEVKTFDNGSSVAKFSVAVKRAYKVKDEWKEETSFFDVEAFGKLVDYLTEKINKGDMVLIEGQLRQDRWETEDGKRSKVKIVAEKVKLIAKPKGEDKEVVPEEEIDAEVEEDIPF